MSSAADYAAEKANRVIARDGRRGRVLVNLDHAALTCHAVQRQLVSLA
jgi:hypothetical protein